MDPRNDTPSQCGPHCDATLCRDGTTSRSYVRTDVLTKNQGYRDGKNFRYVTRTRARPIFRFAAIGRAS